MAKSVERYLQGNRSRRRDQYAGTIATEEDIRNRKDFEFRRAASAYESGKITPVMLAYYRKKIESRARII